MRRNNAVIRSSGSLARWHLISLFQEGNLAFQLKISTMKRVDLSDLTDLSALSFALDQTLFLLANAPFQLRPSALSRALGISSSVLTRMRLVHVNPQYEPFVNQHAVFKVLRYLMQRFPTLILRQSSEGDIQVHLYKRYGRHKLNLLEAALPPCQLFPKNLPKPGSTRWFLAQLDQEQDLHLKL